MGRSMGKVLIAVIFLVLLSGCIDIISLYLDPQLQMMLVNCEELEIQCEKERCYHEVAVAKENFLVCDKIRDVCSGSYPGGDVCLQCRRRCYLAIIEEAEGSSICLRVPESVKDECYVHFAHRERDISLCDKTTYDTHLCYSYFIGNKSNASLCDMIEDADYRDRCYKEVARKLNDVSLCNMIEDIDYKDECHKEAAIKLWNISICDEIQRPWIKDECYERLNQ